MFTSQLQSYKERIMLLEKKLSNNNNNYEILVNINSEYRDHGHRNIDYIYSIYNLNKIVYLIYIIYILSIQVV